MSAVAASAASAGADAALFAGAGAIVVSLAELVVELYQSREMAQDLVDSVAGLQPQLKSMLDSGRTTVTTNAITQYYTLLVSIQTCLQSHITCGRLVRLTKHWDMKKRIQAFHGERARIEALLQLEFMDESSEKNAQLVTLVEGVALTNERIEEQHKDGLETMQTMINELPMATATQVNESLAPTLVALADLKHEIKVNAMEYSAPELKMMKQLFFAGCDAYHIPRESLSLPHWYVSRASVRFDRDDPFASGQFHNVHYGTLESGARVAVNVVNAELEDSNVRERFVKEVTTVSLLRDPHILPFYGANHVGSPLLYVTAIASHGNFRTYLATHRDCLWQLFLDAARGLAYLHRNKLVHGNLKCGNLLVLADGTGVVSDFMFAFVRASSVLSLKTKPTTYDWTAPECLGLGKDANPRFESDVYALGLCLIEAVTGKRPFEDVTTSDEATRERIRTGELPDWSAQHTIPPAVTQLVAKMCAREFTDRAKLSDVIRILEVLAAQEHDVREAATREAVPAPEQRL